MYAATFKPREEDPASENILVSPYVELQLGHVQLATNYLWQSLQYMIHENSLARA
jgi:hypothetical protein